ncbi:VOC family protein [Pigmentiphaga aceris]|uniref:Bleomycin resistance protein n=1 Tax=Pigmentiphaga aceris TaxID=1940612 RepID=A0A5C0ARY9_9BURK|nr:VOC family protein [Pigmentiphaga aceris]QEI04406.1 VOC family protein [Pigmentiphaga aceris]
MQNTRFGQAISVLTSLDMARTLAYYNQVLGFKTTHFKDHAYGIAVRADVELHFWACSDKHIAENTSCYIHVHDIQAVHRDLSLRFPNLSPIVHAPWGMDEFHLIDPDGNLIKFGQDSAAL